MLNIGKLRRGGENYYLISVARGVEDYYVGSGEAPGYWLAAGATDLGLTGVVGEDELRRVLNGSHPLRAQRLAKPYKDRVPGFDLTFRAPKSVSILHALGPKEASNEVVSAHDAAVAAALGYLERQASAARRGRGGKHKIPSKGFIGAAFRHRTSRAGDPLLHTHVLVANLIQGIDGKWGALDARHLYTQAKTAGFLYQAHLRAELTRRLGVTWTPVVKGAADIEGIPRSVIRAFSKRREEIEESLGDLSDVSRRAAEVAALATRKAKDYEISPEALLPQWRRRAEAFGLTQETLCSTLGRTQYRGPSVAEAVVIERELAGPEGLTSQTSSFGRKEAVQGWCAALPLGASVDDIEARVEDFLGSDAVIPLTSRYPANARSDTAQALFSTHEMLAVEREVLERARNRRSESAGVVQPLLVEGSLSRRPDLYDDQQDMVRQLTTSGFGVEIVVGKAGSGKTYALDAAREAWERSGYQVIGSALSARAARELEAGSGIPSCTLARLLKDLDDPAHGGLARNSVVVVDEAGMVGTRTLRRLLAHSEQAKAKLVLVGDDRQLPEIEAGGAFRGIKNRLPAISLSEVRRQPFGWERDALELIRDGRAQDALATYDEHGRVFVGASAQETRERLVADWWKAYTNGEPAIMLAARKSEVAELNDQARSLMLDSGRLGAKSVEVGSKSFAVGDRVMTLRNSRALGVVNGTRGVIEEIDLDTRRVTMRSDEGTVVSLPRLYLGAGHLTHGYAITGHKAQGMTTQRAFVLGDETLYREWTYVAMSRGREQNYLYVMAGVDPERDEVGGEIEPVTDAMTEVTRALGRSRAKRLALDVCADDIAREAPEVRTRERHPDRVSREPRGIERALELSRATARFH